MEFTSAVAVTNEALTRIKMLKPWKDFLNEINRYAASYNIVRTLLDSLIEEWKIFE